MKFKNLIQLKRLVVLTNQKRTKDRIEILFPQMFSDGQWGVCLVFGECEDHRVLQPFFNYIIHNSLHWFVSATTGEIHIHIQ